MKKNKLAEIFFGEQIKRVENLGDTRFSHYTTAEVAISIIRHKKIWMRSAGVMNDSSEFDYANEILKDYWNRESFNKILERIDSKLPKVFERFRSLNFAVRRDKVFISCLSEHTDSEDEYGRLSMWRAYGSGNGVALIFKNSFLHANTYQYGLSTSAVAYLDKHDFAEKFISFEEKIKNNIDYLRGLNDTNHVIYSLIRAAQFAIMSTKHPAFSEEREWRIISEPIQENVDFLKTDVESIGGVPQLVRKFSLDDNLKKHINIDIGDVLESILIGPTKYPEQIKLAIEKELYDAGLSRIAKKVKCTYVPLVT